MAAGRLATGSLLSRCCVIVTVTLTASSAIPPMCSDIPLTSIFGVSGIPWTADRDLIGGYRGLGFYRGLTCADITPNATKAQEVIDSVSDVPVTFLHMQGAQITAGGSKQGQFYSSMLAIIGGMMPALSISNVCNELFMTNHIQAAQLGITPLTVDQVTHSFCTRSLYTLFYCPRPADRRAAHAGGAPPRDLYLQIPSQLKGFGNSMQPLAVQLGLQGQE